MVGEKWDSQFMDDTPRYIGYPLVYNLLQFAIEAMAQTIYS